MSATFSRVKTWIAGEILTAADLNAEFDSVLTNLTPAGIDDASATTGAMQTTADPYPGSVVSAPTSLEGEIQRLRYVLAAITGKTYWYYDVSLLPAFEGLTAAANKLPYFTGAAAMSVADLSAFGMTLIDDATAAASRVTLGIAMTGVTAIDGTDHAQAGTGTADGSSWTIPAGFLTAGKALRIRIAGTLAGGNNAPTVHLSIDGAQIVSLLFPAATVGDWSAEFIIVEHTDTAHQKVTGTVVTAAGAGIVTDYATDTTDTTSAFIVKTQVQSANAGDTITQTIGTIEVLN